MVQKQRRSGRALGWQALVLGAAVLATPVAALASCRVTDFSDHPLSSLSDAERLSFMRQMTQTEYDRLKGAAPGSPNYVPLIANSANYGEARSAAETKLFTLQSQMQNVEDFATIWASDFLTDEKMRQFVTCSSSRRPGIVFAGRHADPNTFNLSFAHLTPIGIEKIRLRLVATHNIANADQLEAFLDGLGEKDNYTAETFPLTLSKPGERAVVVVRAGWETPLFIYIPPYPAPEIR
jgi:hypothetical protein